MMNLLVVKELSLCKTVNVYCRKISFLEQFGLKIIEHPSPMSLWSAGNYLQPE